MGKTTGIEWTDSTWNPIRGCSRVSEGCRNCYAESVAARFSGPGQAYEGLAEFRVIGKGTPEEHVESRWTGEVRIIESHLEDPIRWKAPRKIFVNSMSDLFHERVSIDSLARIFAVMQACPQHKFQVLTKRPERMRELLTFEFADEHMNPAGEEIAAEHGWCHAHEGEHWPLPNVWLGVSVEDQKTANERIPLLLKTAGAVRFVSYEPALGPVDFTTIRYPDHPDIPINSLKCVVPRHLDWVICGGESGQHARPMNTDWARGVRDECNAAGVPFFFKQYGEWGPEGPVNSRQCAVSDDGRVVEPVVLDEFPKWNAGRSWQVMYRVGKHQTRAVLDGIEWKEFPK